MIRLPFSQPAFLPRQGDFGPVARNARRASWWNIAGAAGLSLLMFWVMRANAEDLPPPEGEFVLSIYGEIGRTTDGAGAYFSHAMLEQLGTTTIETSTPWSDDVERYEGVLARDVMKAVDAQADTVIVTALNDYIAEIPISDFDCYDVIFAFKTNGTYLTPRNRGPIFIVYPYDSDPDLQNETIYARSVWQVTRIDVK